MIAKRDSLGRISSRPLAERFWEKVDKTDGCWNWTGAKDVHGYGTISGDDRLRKRAHRVAFQLSRGTPPHGKDLHHTCENKGCVNPFHLAPLSRKEHYQVSPAMKETIKAALKAAQNKPRSTHCKWGHMFNEQNTYYWKTKGRIARTCRACNLRYAHIRRSRHVKGEK